MRFNSSRFSLPIPLPSTPFGSEARFYTASVLLALLMMGGGLAVQPTHGQTPFVTTWETTTAGESITIPTKGSGYDFDVDWGDGATTTNVTGPDPDPSHTYTSAGTYTVTITLNVIPGGFSRIYCAQNSTNAAKLQSIDQWGDPRWQSMRGAFDGASNMTYNASDTPVLSSVSSMRRMFADASSFNGDIGGWNVSTVSNMRQIFLRASNFNQSLNGWDVSNVTTMQSMFSEATSFNGDVTGWDVSSVTNMRSMFQGATNFNRDISGWSVSSVTTMQQMFFGASSFDQPIGSWNVSSVANMNSMFFNASNLATGRFSEVGFQAHTDRSPVG